MWLTGKSKPQFFRGGAHAVARFLHGGVRQTDEVEGGKPGGNIRFHFDKKCLHAEKPHAVGF